MIQCALFYCDLRKQKISIWYFPFVNIATLPDRTNQTFQAGYFNFALMKASVELCINKLSHAAAKSEFKANCEKFDSELGEVGMPDDLADLSVCQMAWRFGTAPKDWQIDHPVYTMGDRTE